MPKRFSQNDRMMRVKFANLGDDDLLLDRFAGTDAVNDLFGFQLDLLAELPLAGSLTFDQVVGQPVAVTFPVPGLQDRSLYGIVSQFSRGLPVSGPDGRYTFVRFRAEMVPRLWRLTKRVNCRIFQKMTVPDILNAVLAGFDVQSHLQSGTYPPREVCTQYRETDFAFVSRLMEEEGIRFYFTHDSGKDILVLRDKTQDQADMPISTTAALNPNWESLQTAPDGIFTWEKTQELASGSYTLWDYLFQTPSTNLGQTQQVSGDPIKIGTADHKLNLARNTEHLEVFDYPGGYAHHHDQGPTQAFDSGTFQQGQSALGEALPPAKQRAARLRMEQAVAASLFCTGSGDCRCFNAGCRFTLTANLPYFDGADDYVLTAVTHSADMNGAYTKGDSSGPIYANQFRCVPAVIQYRPPSRTPKPRIAGVQTAVVVGTSGTDVSTDAYGRVQVQFFWDRAAHRGLNDQKGEPVTTFNYWPGPAPSVPTSSLWVRVAQGWAGRKFGAIFIPRLGQEVAVGFLDGDPDRPLLLGNVYNYVNQPPFPLPGGNQISGVKTHTPGGDDQAFSGLAFSDNPGKETVHLQSERRLIINAEEDLILNVGRDLVFNVNGVQRRTHGSLPGPG